MTEQSTALMIPLPVDMADLFSADDKVEKVIADVRAAIRSTVTDLTTRKGRDAIASLAAKVSKSKTYLDDEGKKLVEDQKRELAVIDKRRKKIRDELDLLRDEARKPLTDWEAAQAALKERDEAILASLSAHGFNGLEPSGEIVAKAGEIKTIALPEDYSLDRDAAEAARAATMQVLRNMFQTAKQREDEAAELAKLRAEAAEREAKEAEEKAIRDAEAKVLRERQEQADREAEASRLAAEQARLETEAAERREKEAVERAQREADERIAAAQREADERVRSAENAARIEREKVEADRLAREQAEADRLRQEAEEKARREADEQRRETVFDEIEAALIAMSGNATPHAIAEALVSGQIPHCTVNF